MELAYSLLGAIQHNAYSVVYVHLQSTKVLTSERLSFNRYEHNVSLELNNKRSEQHGVKFVKTQQIP